ncbi:Epidermal retinol dehydrogenase 2 [Papilio machaon]|uniref:Epidermal retinol dehydrogenase 2 n=1 Tax=Papilio machaon TaxID=76193 RepID=A0A194R0U1_PAPMA|nr:Epidermal retinol dehydrogenase 2 [Papilio machaon]
MWVVVNTNYAILQAVYGFFNPPPLKSLKTETALIIGSGRGVGRQIAIQLSELGAVVLCVDKNVTNNEDTVKLIRSRGGKAYIYECDIIRKENFAVQGLAESLMEHLRINKTDGVYVTLTHIYPFIVDENSDLRLRISSYFGTITPEKAAKSILDSVRRNYPEASVPKHLLYLGHILRILPRKATVLIRDLLDTGVDFA